MQAVIYIFRCPRGRVYAGRRNVSPEAVRCWPGRGEGPLPDGYTGSGNPWWKVARKHRAALVWRILARVEGDRETVDRTERRAISLARAVFGRLCLNVREGGEGATSADVRALWASPEFAARNAAGQKAAQNRPDVKARHRATNAKPGVKAKRSAAQREAQNRPEVWARTVATHNSPEVRATKSAAMKEAQNRPEVRARKRITATEANARPEVRAKISARRRAQAQTPEGRSQLDAARASRTPEVLSRAAVTKRLNDGWRRLAVQCPGLFSNNE